MDSHFRLVSRSLFSRRARLASAAALVGTILATLLATPAGASARRQESSGAHPLASHGPVLPTNGAWFGGYSTHIKGGSETGDEAFLAFEDLIGRKQAVKRSYHLWNDQFPNDDERWVRDRGTTLIMSWQSSNAGVPEAYWRDIAAGQYDSLIDDRAADIKAFGAPIFFTFHQEPESGELDTGTAAEFVSAWRHIHDRFATDGVTNVSWVLVLLSYTYANDGAEEWYPGDGYVDLLGADAYNWFNCPPGVWKTFDQLLSDFHDYGLTKGKPELIAELGSIEDPDVPGAKAAWFEDASATLKTWPEVKALSYYNEGTENGGPCDWWVDSSDSSLAAFQAMGADPYFNPPPPLVSVDSGPPDPGNDSTPTFAFSSNIPGTTFTCATDVGVATACSSPYTTKLLADGIHTLSITGTDPGSGLPGAVLYTWTVDTVPPVLTIQSRPNTYTPDTDAHFWITSNELGSTLTCQLDAGPPSPCAQNVDYSGLAEGSHTFEATATDPAGNVSAPVTATWTIDSIPPTVTITSRPGSLTNSKTATFTFSSNESGSTFTCQKDTGSSLLCTSPKTYTWVTDGAHTFSVIAKDQAGNNSTAATASWTVDATRPIVTITSGPAKNTNATTAGFGFTVSDANTVTSTCQLDSQTPAPCGPGSGGSAADTFSRTAVDSWGPADSGQTWKFPADNLLADFDVPGTVGTVQLSAANVARLAYVPLTWGDQEETFRFSLTKMPTTSRVIAYGVGRYDPSGGGFYAVRASVVYDGSVRLDATKKPSNGTEIALGTDVRFTGIGAANTWYWVRARFTNEGSNVRIQGKVWKDGTPEPLDWSYSYLDTSSPLSGNGRPGLRAQSWSTEVPFTVSFDDLSATSGLTYSGLTDGTHTETITATDGAGNIGTATWKWTVDTAPPIATITSKPSNPTTQTSATFKFTSSEGGSTFTCKLDAKNATTCTSPTTYTGLVLGSHTFTLTATDKVGNISAPVTYVWTITALKPT